MGRKITFLLFFFCAVCILIPAYSQYFPAGARIRGMAGAGLLLEDPFSGFCNPAGLAGLKNAEIAASHEMPYLMNDLSVSSLTFAFPASPGVFGFNGSSAGFSLWRETRTGVSFARKFGSRFSAGLQIDGFFARVPDDIPVRPVFTWEAGLLSQPVADLLVGVHLFNPLHADYPDTRNQRLPVSFAFGAGYRFAKKFLLAAEAEKDLLYPIAFRIGIEYEPVKNVFLRYGYNSVNGYAAGFGLRISHFVIDAAFTRHLQLGYTPSLSLGYVF
ncbi:MAG: hypothetical protein GX419_06130 [Bacteroidales bacterium]|nr:hypothetical protein [Bacteroidales bacterium]